MVLVLACAITTQAQVWLGGSVNFNSSTESTTYQVEGVDMDVDNTTSFILAPEVGYSFGDCSVALALGYGQEKAKLSGEYLGVNYDGVIKNSALLVSPYFRYNVCNVEKFTFFLDACADFALVKSGFGSVSVGTTTEEIEGDSNWSHQFGVKPGVAFHPTEKWAAVFHCGFLGYSDGTYSGFYDQGFNCNFSPAMSTLGLYYNF